jgi:ribosomal protein S18 acetylase RimI-like enzyme
MRENKFKLRPATLFDLDAVYNLMIQQNFEDFGSSPLSIEDLRKRWQESDFSLSKHSQGAFSADDQLVGYAEIRPYHPNQFSIHLYLSPSSSHELGQQLLTTLEAGLEPGTQLIAQVSDKNSQNQQTFAAAGYERNLTFLIMEIEMTEAPPAPVGPAGIEVRPFIPNQDDQATYETDEEASLDKEYSNPMSFAAWAKRMSLSTERFDPTLWFLACHEEEVVGVSLNFYLPESDCGLIDHLGVRRKWRGRGIGLALLQQSFATFFARGIKKVQLSVDSGSLTNAPRLYEKAGMQTVQAYHIYSKTII